MATKSNNIQGNPYHDESTGEFTSANDGSTKTSKFKLKENVTLPSSKISKFKLKTEVGDIRTHLKMVNQVSSIPFLTSSYDVEEHIEEFFTDDIVKSIDSYFGKFAVPYKYFNLRTDPQQRCGVNIFAACIGKKRFVNNYIRLIDKQEYDNLSNNRNYVRLFRGLRGNDQEFELISNSYSSRENEMIYGSVGGTAYGIAVYASDDIWEARGYAGSNTNHVMNLILNENSRTMNYGTIKTIRNQLSGRKQQILPRIEKIFLDKGIEPSRAANMTKSFGITLDDEGFVAMLCGVEWYKSGSYHMIENLGTVYRLLDRRQ